VVLQPCSATNAANATSVASGNNTVGETGLVWAATFVSFARGMNHQCLADRNAAHIATRRIFRDRFGHARACTTIVDPSVGSMTPFNAP
jgi:homoaconitase/3-isopropylmalate dehydratase large subunit